MGKSNSGRPVESRYGEIGTVLPPNLSRPTSRAGTARANPTASHGNHPDRFRARFLLPSSRLRKNGAPITAVRMPSGIPTGKAFREQERDNAPPMPPPGWAPFPPLGSISANWPTSRSRWTELSHAQKQRPKGVHLPGRCFLYIINLQVREKQYPRPRPREKMK